MADLTKNTGFPLLPMDWLNQPWLASLPSDKEMLALIPDCDNPTLLQVLAFYIAKNNYKFYLCDGYHIRREGGLYGAEGLTGNEALQLIKMTSYLGGLLARLGETLDLKPFEAEWDRVRKFREAQICTSPKRGQS